MNPRRSEFLSDYGNKEYVFLIQSRGLEGIGVIGLLKIVSV